MGLDMCLYAKKSLYKYTGSNHKNIERIIEMAGMSEYAESDDFAELHVNVIYWRKANAVHRWFVENVQDGVDDCQPYHVTHSKLAELKSICDVILEDNDMANTLLPPGSGFFFGSTQVDQFYLDDLKWTSDKIGKLLELLKDSDGSISFYYQSSW